MRKLLFILLLFLSTLCFAGGSTNFDGTDDYTNVGSNSSIDDIASVALTVVAWIYPRTTGDAGTGRIANKRPVGSTGGWLFFTDDTASIGAQTVDSGAAAEANSRGADNAIRLNSWNHVAMTYNDLGDKVIRLYVGGREIAYQTQTAGVTSPGTDADGNLIIGDSANDFIRSFNGLMAYVRIFKSALTEDQVIESMNCGDFVTNDLVGYWPFWDGAIQYDLSNFNNDGINVNGPTLSQDGPPTNICYGGVM
jgi:hypothetical protein